jgi:hypothetical protein
MKMIQKHGAPIGWKPADLQRAAIVARFHCGALPTRKHKSLRDLLPDEQKGIIQLAAILRLANAFDAKHDGRIKRIHVENVLDNVGGSGIRRTAGLLRKAPVLPKNAPLILAAEGYLPFGASAQTIAAERHLLETVLHRAVIIRAMKNLGRAG